MRINDTVCRLRVEVDGTKIEVGPVKASEAEKITAWTGYTLREWEIKVESGGDSLALKALLALVEFRKGEHTRKLSSFDVEDMDSVKAEFVDERGRVVSTLWKDGEPVVENNAPVLLFDGQREDGAPFGQDAEQTD